MMTPWGNGRVLPYLAYDGDVPLDRIWFVAFQSGPGCSKSQRAVNSIQWINRYPVDRI